MHVREVKAYVHRTRITDVVSALKCAGFENITVIDIAGIPNAVDGQEERFRVAIERNVTTNVKLELMCENETQTAQAVELIRANAKTGNTSAGWIYITQIQSAIEITS